MNKCILILTGFYPLLIFSQVKDFKVPSANDGYLSKSVFHNDTVVIHEPKAWIVSEKSFVAYEAMKENYLNCIKHFKQEVDKTTAAFARFDSSFQKINEWINQQTQLTGHQLTEAKTGLQQVLENLTLQMSQLQEVHETIELATSRLNEIEMKLRREQRRLTRRRIFDMAVAGGTGLLIGILLLN